MKRPKAGLPYGSKDPNSTYSQYYKMFLWEWDVLEECLYLEFWDWTKLPIVVKVQAINKELPAVSQP